MIPTLKTYWLLLGSGGVAIALAVILPGDYAIVQALGLMLLADLVLLGAALLDALQSKNDRITVERSPFTRLSIGRDNPIEITVQAKARSAKIQLRDAYPLQHFTVSQDTLTAQLAPQETQILTYTAKPTLRGEYTWGKLQVRQQTPWGLLWLDWKTGDREKVEVYPDLIGLRSLTIKLALQSAGAMRQRRRFGMGTEFAELREYSSGDDPRLIDWKATARRNRPLVRVLEPEHEQTLIILLDRGRLMTAQVEGLTRFDWGLNAALSLALTGIKRGDRVGVGVFDRTLQTWIPPQRGATHFNHLLERLTPIQPDLIEPDYGNAVSAVLSQQSRRALVVVLTDIVDTTASSELMAALSKLSPRYLPFCVTLRDPEIDRIAAPFQTQTAEFIAAPVQQAYERSVALDLLAQRQAAFATLKRQGVLVLDAPAHQICDPLVDRYLQLKARNQL